MVKLLRIFALAFFSQVFAQRENEDCKISVEGDGRCRTFKNCPSLDAIIENKPISFSDKQLLRSRNCGKNEDNKRLVCCSKLEGTPPGSNEGSDDRENEECKILVDGDGTCRVFMECPSLYAIIENNESITNEDKQLIKSRSCGISKENKRLVCCSKSEGVIRISADERTCTTPNGELGQCTLSMKCPALSFSENPTESERKFLEASICSRNGLKIFICCPKQQPTTTTTTTTIASVPDKENSQCVDSSNNSGTCVPLRNCSKLFALYNTRPRTKKINSLIKSNFCGFDEEKGKYFVCCSPEPFFDELEKTTTAKPILTTTSATSEVSFPWLESLKSKVNPESCFTIPDRLFGGTVTAIDEYPWTVLLEFARLGNVIELSCGGSLINKRYVLTAAHCVWDLDKEKQLKHVRLGEWNVDTEKDCSPADKTFCAPPYLTVGVANILMHPRFRNVQSRHHDIAILRLAEEVEFNRFVSPICLPLDPSLWNMNQTGNHFEVVGWGRKEGYLRSSTKRRAEIPFISHAHCTKFFKSHGVNIIKSQTCAGGKEGVDTCNGDSGGPLMKYNEENVDASYWYLEGIVSFGIGGCGVAGHPGVYTKVSDFLEWIEKNIE